MPWKHFQMISINRVGIGLQREMSEINPTDILQHFKAKELTSFSGLLYWANIMIEYDNYAVN